MKEILPGLYAIPGPLGIMMMGRYVIQDADGLTLVDTGQPGGEETIARHLAGIGRSLSDIRRILITHYHQDHIGNLPGLKEMSHAQVICSPVEKPYIQGELPDNVSGKPLPGTPVDRTVEDGEMLPEVMGGLQAVLCPGHTPGHTAFWQPQQRVLFCGDVVFHVLGLRQPPRAFSVDPVQARRAVGRLAELEPDMICFGHGSVLTRNAAQRLHRFAERVAP